MYQVVATCPSGNEYDIRGPHATLEAAQAHADRCKTAWPDENYQVREIVRRCAICHEEGGHTLSCPTRWYQS